MGAASLALASVVSASGCLSRSPTLDPGSPGTVFARRVPLDTESLDLQLVRPPPGARRPLVLYATGDGGWRSADRGLFRHIERWGYPLAGFSARQYLEHLGFEATTPAHVATDYGRLVAFARQALELPDGTPTVLVGFSRGSALAVVAAGQPELQPALGGVLAVALDDEEEYVRDEGTRDPVAGELAKLRPYESVARLHRLPLAVIQSTRDRYLPAAGARQLFGPDGDRRRFCAIEARGHTFGGARDALYEQARVSLEWIAAFGAPGTLGVERGAADP